MEEHVDDFLPFVPASQDGEMCSLGWSLLI